MNKRELLKRFFGARAAAMVVRAARVVSENVLATVMRSGRRGRRGVRVAVDVAIGVHISISIDIAIGVHVRV